MAHGARVRVSPVDLRAYYRSSYAYSAGGWFPGGRSSRRWSRTGLRTRTRGTNARDGSVLMTSLATDVLVVGTGAGGLTAALTAASAGRSVVVCEKAAHWGGTSATSGGFIWIPASSLAAAAGADDSVEEA